ncbi:uncharacterized protein BYT42DRAFT_560509 [Radiomyces spectabilis]|uniref:uncharacterized protein n=1 Tax=Radiomyces spectabilis TaxID=64574 RepID=UPI0022202187|nr:uncharacterized protein BYT42DRAFT_560509 [Radiomyces spectabilis]KAI8388559.1 hypothetical protein BYT42DRAFT_560509 [Radiomyces spectabilis]
MSFPLSVLRLEKLLTCAICDSPLQAPRRINPCGHLFCLDCLEEKLQTEDRCPTCGYSVTAEDITEDRVHQDMVRYLGKLKETLIGTSLTPFTASLGAMNTFDSSRTKRKGVD